MVLDLAPRGAPREHPVCLIGAQNGVGKTSVLDAIRMALYGRRAPLRGPRAWVAQLLAHRHRWAPEEALTVVELEFTTFEEGRARRYRVRRQWAPAGSGVSERLFVMVNGAFSEEETELWDQRAEELLPLGLSGLCLFDGELIRAFAAASEPTPEVRAALAAVLGLDLASRLDRDLDAVALRRRGALVQPEEIAAVDALETRMSALREQIAESEARRASLAAELEAARKQIAGDRASTPPSEEAARVDDAEERLAVARRELIELAQGWLPLALVPDLARTVLAQGQEEVRAAAEARLAERLNARDATLAQILARHDGGGALGDEIRAWIREDLAERETRRALASWLGATPAEVDALARALGGGLAAEQERAKAALAESQWAHGELRRARARSERDETSGAEGLETLTMRAAELGRADEGIARLRDELRRVEIDHRRRLEQLRARHIAEAESRRVVETAARVQRVLGDYQRELVGRRIDELERRVTVRLQELDQKQGRVGHVWIDPNHFALRLTDPEGRSIDRERLSAGEQQILAVAFLWALADSAGRDLPVVIDTPLARLDRAYRQRLVDVFFPRVSHQLVLLSTDAEISGEDRECMERMGALSHCCTLRYDARERRSEVLPGYFEEKR